MVKIRKDGTFEGANSVADAMYALAASIGKLRTENVAALTDNSGGDDTPTADKVQYVAAFTSTAASGSNLADKTTTEAALGKVKNAVTELAAQTNAMAAALNLTALTDNSGGTSADGTIAACDASVTGASTGSLKANMDSIGATINAAFVNIARKVNECARACGVAEVNVDATLSAAVAVSTVVAAISTSTGTAASPAASKAEVDAALVKWRDNVAYLAAKLNELSTEGAAAAVAG